MVINRHGQHGFCGVLPNYILVQPCLDLRGGKHVDLIFRFRGLCAALARARPGLVHVNAFLPQKGGAQFNALVADIHARANNHALYFILRFPAEIAKQRFLFVVLICHIGSLIAV